MDHVEILIRYSSLHLWSNNHHSLTVHASDALEDFVVRNLKSENYVILCDEPSTWATRWFGRSELLNTIRNLTDGHEPSIASDFW